MTRKAGRAETPAQAAAWQRTMRQYLALGLCHGCSCQAAYGHQIGFTLSHAPCPSCVLVVAGFALPASNGWRKASLEQRQTPAQHARWPSGVSQCAGVPASTSRGTFQAVSEGVRAVAA